MSQSDLGVLNLSITHSTNNVIITLEIVVMYLLTGILILYNTGGFVSTVISQKNGKPEVKTVVR